jgi:hypothetical protein
MRRVGIDLCAVLFAAWAFANGAAAEATPTSVGLLCSAEKGDAHLKSLRETVRSTLKEKSISVETVIFECSPDAECMRGALRDAGAEVGVYVWLWEATPDRPDAVVGVMLKEAGGVAGFDEVAEERSCSASACDEVAQELIHQLLERWPERRGTRLQLTGTPRGAAVFDGASLVGTVPGDFQLTRGEHRFRIASKGYEPEVLLLNAGPTPEEARHVDLVPLTEDKGPIDRGGRQRSAAMIASGVVLLAGGGALIGLGGASYARSGGCEGTVPCQSYTTSSAGAGVMLGVGIASVGGGLGLLIKGIRDR